MRLLLVLGCSPLALATEDLCYKVSWDLLESRSDAGGLSSESVIRPVQKMPASHPAVANAGAPDDTCPNSAAADALLIPAGADMPRQGRREFRPLG